MHKNIVSNCSSKFTLAFWEALSKTLGIKQRQSTAYHPQTNSQTEQVNQLRGQYLRILTNCNRDHWPDWLLMAKFVYTLTLDLMMTPFFVNFSYNSTITIRLDQAVGTPFETDVQQLHPIYAHCRQEIQNVIAALKEYANHKRMIGPGFKIGFKVWLPTANLCLKPPMHKLAEKRLSPI